MSALTTPMPYLQLDLPIDLLGMQQDLEQCLQYEWPAHFNQKDFEGTWKLIALRSASGQATEAYAHQDTAFKDTPLLAQCPHIQDFLAGFQCKLGAVRLLNLAPGSLIHTHRDFGLAYAEGEFRLHVPLQTDEAAVFTVAGHERHIPLGTCWYANFALPHSVAHRGQRPRIHLVIDGHRNPWTDELFIRSGMDLDAEDHLIQAQVLADRDKVIAALLELGTPAALEAAARMRGRS